jgi:hypothetical protein
MFNSMRTIDLQSLTLLGRTTQLSGMYSGATGVAGGPSLCWKETSPAASRAIASGGGTHRVEELEVGLVMAGEGVGYRVLVFGTAIDAGYQAPLAVGSAGHGTGASGCCRERYNADPVAEKCSAGRRRCGIRLLPCQQLRLLPDELV